MFPAYLVMTNASGCTSNVVFLVDAFDVQGGYRHRQFGGVPELGSRFPRGKWIVLALAPHLDASWCTWRESVQTTEPPDRVAHQSGHAWRRLNRGVVGGSLSPGKVMGPERSIVDGASRSRGLTNEDCWSPCGGGEPANRFPRGKRLAAAVVDITLPSIERMAARQIVGPAFPGESELFPPSRAPGHLSVSLACNCPDDVAARPLGITSVDC